MAKKKAGSSHKADKPIDPSQAARNTEKRMQEMPMSFKRPGVTNPRSPQDIKSGKGSANNNKK